MSIDSASSIISIPEGALFATVNSYQICELDKDKFTIFKLEVKLGSQIWTLDRRYNEFDRLNTEIKKIDPDLKIKLPGKRLFNFSLDFITKRMRGLDEFIKIAISHPIVLKLPALWEFLNITESHIQFLENEKNITKLQRNSNFMENRQNSNDDDDGMNEDDFMNLGSSHNPVAKASDFEFLKVIGKGSFGKVYQANHKNENKIYAIKVLKKEAIIKRNEVKHIMAERNVLIRNLKHPFLVGLHYSFQSRDKLYFVLDYVSGGELFYHLIRKRIFPEPRVKFYAAEIAHAIGYMHLENIIYRDLKPENILIANDGHIRLTDFGLCKEGIQANTTTSTFCGTPEYLAPEILLKKPYTRAVDWWCLGSVIYEMLFGLPPFYSKDQNQMYNNILYQPLRLNHTIPASPQVKHLISGLLQKDQSIRLGANQLDFCEIRDHPFFYDLNWQDLLDKKLQVPWLPELDNETDTSYIDREFTDEKISASVGQSMIENSLISGKKDMAFTGFTYVEDSNIN